MSVQQLYEATLAERGYTADEAQRRGVAALQRCEDEWAAYKPQARRGSRAKAAGLAIDSKWMPALPRAG